MEPKKKYKFREVAHMYPNCPILIYNGGEPVSSTLEGIDFLQDKPISERVNYEWEQIKPILRKREDLNDDELIQILEFTENQQKNFHDASSYEVYVKLTSEYFLDEFGLIDNKEAVRAGYF